MKVTTAVEFKYQLTETEQLNFEILLAFTKDLITKYAGDKEVQDNAKHIQSMITEFDLQISRAKESNIFVLEDN